MLSPLVRDGARSAAPLSLGWSLSLALALVASPAAAGEGHETTWAHPLPAGNPLYGVAFSDASLGIAVGLVGTVIRTIDGGDSWSSVPDTLGVLPDLHGVVAIDSSTWVAVGGGAGTYRSTDGGATWTEVPRPASGGLRSLARAGADLVAVGEHGLVLRSSDAGQSWTVSPPPADVLLTAQAWLDAARGIVVAGDFNELATPAYRTTDGGQTWSSLAGVTPSGLRNVVFLDAQSGFVFGESSTFRTDDAGQSFADLGQAFPFYALDLLPLTSQRWLTAQFGEGAEIALTTDGGQQFSLQYDQSQHGGVTSLEEAPGGRVVATLMSGMILTSDDAGLTWTPRLDDAVDGEGPTIARVELLEDGRAFAATNRLGPLVERWLVSDDGGRTFSAGATPPPAWIFEDVVFRGGQLGFVAGLGPSTLHHVLRTQDGGQTWTTHALPFTGPGTMTPQRLAVPSPTRVYVTAMDGGTQPQHRVYRSKDGGTTYEDAMTGLNPGLPWRGISFVDDQTGFVATDGFTTRLFVTTDGGDQWTERAATGIGSRLRHLWFGDANLGLAACFEGVYRTVDGGATFSLASPGTAWDLDMRPDGRGVALGTAEGGVRWTANGGLSWETVELPWHDWNPLAAIPFLHTAVGVGPDGFVVGGGFSNLVHVAVAPPIVCQPDLGFAGPGALTLSVCGEPLAAGGHADLRVDGAPPFAAVFVAAATTTAPAPLLGGTLVPGPVPHFLAFAADHGGVVDLPGIPGGAGPLDVHAQALAADPGVPLGVAFSNAVRIEFLP